MTTTSSTTSTTTTSTTTTSTTPAAPAADYDYDETERGKKKKAQQAYEQYQQQQQQNNQYNNNNNQNYGNNNNNNNYNAGNEHVHEHNYEFNGDANTKPIDEKFKNFVDKSGQTCYTCSGVDYDDCYANGTFVDCDEYNGSCYLEVRKDKGELILDSNTLKEVFRNWVSFQCFNKI